MTSRRSFLGLIGAAAVGLVAHELDLDRLLWVPGEKTIFLPSVAPVLDVSTFGGNQLITAEWITREALRILKSQLALTQDIHRAYDVQFAVEGAKIGTVVNVRPPQRFQM